jgi:hypothetical protein
MTRSYIRVWLAQITLFLIFEGNLFAAIILSKNLAQWLSDAVPGRARPFEYSIVVLVSVLVELPLFSYLGLLCFRAWRLVCSQLLPPEDMNRLQSSLRRL